MYSVSFITFSLSYLYAAPLLRLARSIHALSLSLIPVFSLDHVHTLRTLIPQRCSPAHSFLRYFSFISLRALTRPHFHWFANFPTKSESSYLARKKKFYHSVSTCSSTSFPRAPSYTGCRSTAVGLPRFFLR